LPSAVGFHEFFMLVHVFPPMPCKVWRCDPATSLERRATGDLKNRNLPANSVGQPDNSS
jgi:hypothetical protein